MPDAGAMACPPGLSCQGRGARAIRIRAAGGGSRTPRARGFAERQARVPTAASQPSSQAQAALPDRVTAAILRPQRGVITRPNSLAVITAGSLLVSTLKLRVSVCSEPSGQTKVTTPSRLRVEPT